MNEVSRYSNKDIKSIDVDSNGKVIIVDSNNWISLENKSIQLENNMQNSILKYINEDMFLLVDCSKDQNKNGKFYSWKGVLLNEICLGSYIHQILIYNNSIIVSYFDEGVFSNEKLSQNGLNVFDFKGNVLYGYNTRNSGEMVECYSIALYENYLYALIYNGLINSPKFVKKINLITLDEKIEIYPSEDFSSIVYVNYNSIGFTIKKSMSEIQFIKYNNEYNTISIDNCELSNPVFLKNNYFFNKTLNEIILFSM